jgi:hypothetical protein
MSLRCCVSGTLCARMRWYGGRVCSCGVIVTLSARVLCHGSIGRMFKPLRCCGRPWP